MVGAQSQYKTAVPYARGTAVSLFIIINSIIFNFGSYDRDRKNARIRSNALSSIFMDDA